MDWIVQGILSFLAAASFGVIFNSPKGTLLHCGFVGATGWLVYYSLIATGHGDVVIASFAGSIAAYIVAHWHAKTGQDTDDHFQCCRDHPSRTREVWRTTPCKNWWKAII